MAYAHDLLPTRKGEEPGFLARVGEISSDRNDNGVGLGNARSSSRDNHLAPAQHAVGIRLYMEISEVDYCEIHMSLPYL